MMEWVLLYNCIQGFVKERTEVAASDIVVPTQFTVNPFKLAPLNFDGSKWAPILTQ
jgi:hypothetical protein